MKLVRATAAIIFAIMPFAASAAYYPAPKQADWVARELADKIIDTRLAAPMPADANDFLWAWGSSADYDAAPDLGKIEAALLAINAADEERNPPETGVTAAALNQVKNGKIYLIPASDQTSGHFMTGSTKFYSQQLRELLHSAPQRAM
jgi:homoserine O-acetyltransferase